MKEIPILFNTPMVQQVLKGNKTQTRRPIIKDLPPCFSWRLIGKKDGVFEFENQYGHLKQVKSPFGQPGDRLWVRETWAMRSHGDLKNKESQWLDEIVYAADAGIERFPVGGNYTPKLSEYRWHPSIHMPRWASRILLEVVDVWPEQAQEINELDARAEGVERSDWIYSCEPWKNYGLKQQKPGYWFATAKASYKSLLDSIYGTTLWDRNGWVMAGKFKELETKCE